MTMQIIGAGGGKSGGGGGGISEEPDTLASVARARFVDLLCEGPIQGLVNNEYSIYLDGVPGRAITGTSNYRAFKYDKREGTQAQPVMKGFAGTQSEEIVGLQITKAMGAVTRTINDADADSVRVTVSVNGLTETSEKGKVSGARVEFAIGVRKVGGYWAVYHKYIEGKASSRYQRSWEFDLKSMGPGPFEVSVERETDDATSSLLVDKLNWDSFTVINYEQLTYPFSALVGVELDARYFSQVPQRAYHIKGLIVQVPLNYNPVTRSYATTGPGTTNGAWNGRFKWAWTNNPAWCFYDLLTNSRYGLGKRISASQIDKWELYSISQYCDGLVPTGIASNIFEEGSGGALSGGGGSSVGASVPLAKQPMEPRFTLNCVLNTREDAHKVLNQIASVFRGMAYWATNSVHLTQDRPTSVTRLFTNANVGPEGFSYQGSSRAQRHTVALVGWNDPKENFKQKFEYVEDREGITRYDVRSTELIAFGCTSRWQARRVGLWYLYTQRLERESIVFTAGLDAADMMPGEVVDIMDNDLAGVRWGGRVVSATTTTVTIDSSVVLSAGTYTFGVMLKTGALIERTVNIATTGPYTTLTLASALPSAPAAMAVWVLSSNTVVPRQARVISKTQDGPTQFKVVCVEHNPTKYDAIEKGEGIEAQDYSFLDYKDIEAPTNLKVTEVSYKRTVTSPVQSDLEVGWDMQTDPLVRGYIVKLLGTNRTSRTLPEQSESNVTIEGVLPVTYVVSVSAVNMLGIVGPPATKTITVTGKDTTPPANVSSATLGYTLDPQVGLTLTWEAVEDFVDFYEIRRGSTWATATLVARSKSDRYVVGPVASGTQRFLVKAVDTSGNYSVTAAQIDISIASASAPVVSFQLIGPDELISWTAPASPFLIESYEVRYGSTWALGQIVTMTKALSLRRKVTYSGERRYWVAAVDVAGNYGTPGSVDTTIFTPSAVTAERAEVIDNNVLLYWSAPSAGSLPVERYEVRKGTTWAAGSGVGSNGNSTFAAIFEQQSGDYIYWVAAVDTAGNEGVPKSIPAKVNQPPDYVLRLNVDSDFSGTRTNMVVESGTLVGPVDTAQTWQQHFSTNSWLSPDDQVNANYPLYAMPGLASGAYEEVFDYGGTIPTTTIAATLGYTVVAGIVSVSCQIYTKLNAGDAWIAAQAGASTVLASNFRYVRVVWSFSCTAGSNLIRVTSFNLKLSNKLKTDSGSATANSGDSGGTTVNFNVEFIDCDTPIVQANSTTPITAVVDFTDTPNPTSFKVMLFNSGGARVSGPFSWTVRGY